MNSLPFLADPITIVVIAIIVVVGGILWLRLHAFIALLLAAFVVALITPGSAIEQFALAAGQSADDARLLAEMGIGERIARAFGNTTAQIGILIAMAAVIGKCLLESGGAERIVRSILKVTGIEKSPIAFAGSSFFLAIPVFMDTVLYLMIPLAKAMYVRLKKNYLLFVLTIAAGSSMAHSLVPPTPGPLFLVAEMQIPIHMMMIGGFLIGIITVTSGYLYAVWINKKMPIKLRSSPDAPVDEMEALSDKGVDELPPLWLAIMPIIIPLVFITANGIINAFLVTDIQNGLLSSVVDFVAFMGDKNTALITGGLIALYMLAKYKTGDKKQLAESMQQALMSGGVIILITAAGGAFGAMLQQTGVSLRISEMTEGYQMALIPLAFLITAVIRTAQGSATVSMITAAGILSGMAANTTLEYHVLYLGLAIAVGSKLVPWMNDSGFWIVSQMSNLTSEETLKSFSVMLTIMGITGFIAIYIAASIFPLV